jgi:DNA-binding HxlR family transcriptional regulator
LERYLEVVSGAGVPRILWYLLDSPHRFGELRRSINGVSAKVLTSKLRALQRQDLVARTVVPSSPPQVTYSLSDPGHMLEPMFRAMEKAARRLVPEPRVLAKALGSTISPGRVGQGGPMNT